MSEIITVSQQKFGELYTGDCGTFAYALKEILKQDGYHNISLYFVTQEDYSEQELIGAQEGEIYHIFVVVEGIFVDGYKIYNSPKDAIDTFDNIIAPDIEDIEEYELDEEDYKSDQMQKDIRRTINWNTNYCFDIQDFFNFMINYLQENNVILNQNKNILIQ